MDEIETLSPPNQAKLLRVLQEKTVTALGDTRSAPVDVRFLAAGQNNLMDVVKQGAFRADLFARLNGYTVHIPPLRARREDLGLLVRAILNRHGGDGESWSFSGPAVQKLFAHNWPLNVRQLEQAIRTALLLVDTDRRIQQKHITGADQARG